MVKNNYFFNFLNVKIKLQQSILTNVFHKKMCDLLSSYLGGGRIIKAKYIEIKNWKNWGGRIIKIT